MTTKKSLDPTKLIANSDSDNPENSDTSKKLGVILRLIFTYSLITCIGAIGLPMYFYIKLKLNIDNAGDVFYLSLVIGLILSTLITMFIEVVIKIMMEEIEKIEMKNKS